MHRHGARSSSRSELRSSTVGMLTTVASYLGTGTNGRRGGPPFLHQRMHKVGASVTTDQACASCIRLALAWLSLPGCACKREVVMVVVGFRLQIAVFGGSRACGCKCHAQNGSFQLFSKSRLLLGASSPRPTCPSSGHRLPAHVSIRLLIIPTKPDAPAGPRSRCAAEIGTDVCCVLSPAWSMWPN